MSRPYCRTALSLPQITTSQRLRLRPLNPDDADAMWRMDTDPEVMRHLLPNEFTQDQYRANFLAELAAGQRFKFIRAIEWLDQRNFLGWVFCRPTEDGLWVEIGYRLTQQSWGRGVATEASEALMTVAAKDWRAQHFMGVTVEDNVGSRNVLQKLGMQHQGKTEDYYDEILEFFTLENDDHAARRQSVQVERER
ncbi:MAG: N-acetyltransferase [Lysobacteraceae bacterium]|nr:MAG: N-acetyltransferase [Xanthomonadaceae bacterium]